MAPWPVVHGALSEIRTLNLSVLSGTPLPVGLKEQDVEFRRSVLIDFSSMSELPMSTSFESTMESIFEWIIESTIGSIIESITEFMS